MKKIFQTAAPYILFHLFATLIFLGVTTLACGGMLLICWASNIVPTVNILFPASLVGIVFASWFIVTEHD